MADMTELSARQLAARSPGESYQQMLTGRPNPVPAALRENTTTYLGSDNLSVDRHLSREFHELEVEKMWKRTWQVVCRRANFDAGIFFDDIARYPSVVTRTEAATSGATTTPACTGASCARTAAARANSNNPLPRLSLEPGR